MLPEQLGLGQMHERYNKYVEGNMRNVSVTIKIKGA